MNAIQPWSKGRLIAVDHGSRCVKLLLVESDGVRVNVVGHKSVDLVEEGLLASEEIQRHIAGLLEEWAEWPLAVTLPAHLSFAQVLDLPAGGEKDIPKVIEEQTGRLRGITNSPFVYEALALAPSARLQKPYLVTIARQQDVDQHIQRLTSRANEVRDVSSLANALVTAHGDLEPALRDYALVDFGASSTLVVMVRGGQEVFASSFAMGANLLADALAHAGKTGTPEAEAQMRARNLFAGAQKSPAVCAAVDAWSVELRKTLDDCRKHAANGPVTEGDVPVVLSGGALRLPGLLDYLQSQRSFAFTPWPRLPGGDEQPSLSDFAAAYGAALAALRRPLDSPSLLPPPLRAHRLQLRQLAKVNAACVVCLLLAALVLGLATWHKASLVARKRDLAQKAEAATVQVRQLENLVRERDQAFERYWPLLDQQERTLDLLHTLRALQQCRSRHDFWCVLVADNDSYSRGTTLPTIVTNRFGLTNAVTLTTEHLSKPAFVIELCVPAKGDQTLKTVGDVVTELRKDAFFGRVDSVPAAQRRALVDPKVLIPDRHFAVAVDLADLGWRSLFEVVKPPEPLTGGTNLLRRPATSPVSRPRPGSLPPPGPAAPSPATPNA